MSLTLPSAFTTKSIIKENWLFQLYYDGGSSFLGLSFYDTNVSSNFYHGAIKNKPSIRESISLEDSTAKTSNVSLSIANFKYNQDDLSAELFGGTRKYINRDVKIYIQPDDDDNLSNCLLVYTGRLTDVSHKADIGFSIGTLFFKYPYELLKYILTKTGMFTSTVAEAGGFIRSRNDIDIPDTQLHFSPGMIVDHGREHMWGTGISCHTCLLRPKSRGEVTLNSADPSDDPKIDPKFLSHPDDVKDMVAGYKKMMKIMNKEPVAKYTSKHVLRPIDLDDDEDIEKAIRETADTVYHPVGTCKMGNDEMAVVDSRLKVHNLEGLRVVDASIMPTLIGGNTNAPTIMIGEKASDMIIQDWQ